MLCHAVQSPSLPAIQVQHYLDSLDNDQMAEQQTLSRALHEFRRKVGHDGDRIEIANNRIEYERNNASEMRVRVSARNTKSIAVLEKLLSPSSTLHVSSPKTSVTVSKSVTGALIVSIGHA